MLQIHKLGLHLVGYKDFWVYLHAVFSWLVTCELIIFLRLVDFWEQKISEFVVLWHPQNLSHHISSISYYLCSVYRMWLKTQTYRRCCLTHWRRTCLNMRRQLMSQKWPELRWNRCCQKKAMWVLDGVLILCAFIIIHQNWKMWSCMISIAPKYPDCRQIESCSMFDHCWCAQWDWNLLRYFYQWIYGLRCKCYYSNQNM